MQQLDVHILLYMHKCLDGYVCIELSCFVPSIHYQDNTTPLSVASRHGHHDVVQSLLDAGADVNKPHMPSVIGAILLLME